MRINATTTLAGAAAALLMAAGGAAADGMSRQGSLKDVQPGLGLLYAADIESAFGWSFINDNNSSLDDDSHAVSSGAARVSIPLRDTFAMQLDMEGAAGFSDRNNGEDNFQSYFAGGWHFAWRDPMQGTFGAFLGSGSANGGDDANATFFLAGLEAQRYFGNLTLYGQVGGLWADDERTHDVITDAWFVRGVARYFMTPNSRLQLQLAYASGSENNGIGDIQALSWGVRFDRQVEGRPFYWFLAYDGMFAENDSGGGYSEDVTDHTFRIGGRYLFGAPSLFDNDRRGVTFDLPDVGRWTAYTTGVID